jgi:hypothetical protein
MTYLVIAVVALGALSLFQLTLTLGVIRKLRVQDAQLAKLNGQDPESATVAIGRRIGDFTATAHDGSLIVGRDSGVMRATAFFTPDCKACSQQLPQFVEFAAAFPGDVVAVVVADDEAQGWAYNEKLVDVARTVIEPTGGVVATAFAVTSFPAMAVTDGDGVVMVNGYAVQDLRILEAAGR